jgi:sugar lactone lactonase YvrE
MSKPELIVDAKNRLGESAMWHPREQVLYWIDARAPALYRLEARGSVTTIPLPAMAGAVVPRKSGGIAIALQHGFHTLDTRTGQLTLIVDPEPDLTDNRINDGSCDRMGRFWAGTQHLTIREPRGSLYRLDSDHTVRNMLHGITVTNMVRFSPDDRTLYYADTYSDLMYALDFSLPDGTISNRRVFVDTSSHPGHPDGSALDADGCLWNAEYGGSRVVRYTPKGKIDRTIEFPVTQPTSCCFGGPNLDTLYVTSATQRIEPDKLAQQPLAGGLFAVHVGVKGLPEAEYAG